jgi:hypothetical protein
MNQYGNRYAVIVDKDDFVTFFFLRMNKKGEDMRPAQKEWFLNKCQEAVQNKFLDNIEVLEKIVEAIKSLRG